MTSVTAQQLPASKSEAVLHRETRSRQFARIAGYFCIVCGLVILVAWWSGASFVWGNRSLVFNVKANTALTILVIGIGLVFSVREKSPLRARQISVGCGIAVAAIGLLTLVQYVVRVDLGIDQLLVREQPGALATTSPGRMGPPAAISFTMIGLSLVLLGREMRGLVPSQILAGAGLLIAFVALLGYMFQAVALYAGPGTTGIALTTAVLLFLCNLAIFAARPAQGIVARICSDDAGGYLIRQLLLPTVLAPCILGLLVRIGERQLGYGSTFGDAILVAFLVVFLSLVKFHRAGLLATLDRRRTQAEFELSRQLGVANAAQAELSERDRRLQEMADTAAAMIWVADTNGQITFSNQSFGVFTGSGASPEINSWLERIHEEDRAAFRSKFQTCFENKQAFRGVARAGRSDGHFRWLDVICQPRINRDGHFFGYVCTAQDVTEAKEFTLERESLLASERAARSQLEHASRMKDEFLSTLSHELRTPLSAVLGWTQLLRRRDGNDAMLIEGLETIERGARAQVQLIEDLLDLSRIASGKVRLNLHALELRPVVEAAIEIVRPSAEAKRIDLRTNFAKDVPPVGGDPARLQQVIWNLLTNAVKFTPAGGEIRVSLDVHNGNVETIVRDTGQGIHPDFLPRVFDRFSQADSRPSRKHGGLGIGLALVKQIVELHGGSVSAASQGVGRGAEFTIRLPVATADQHAHFPTLEPVVGKQTFGKEISLAGVNVLIVDDDAAARDVLARLLGQFDATTILAGSAEEALAKLGEVRPDLLISDIGMPDMDGFELMRRIRASGNRLPAVALTAFARPEDRIACLRAGYDMHLAKPVDPRELLAVVASVTRTARPADSTN